MPKQLSSPWSLWAAFRNAVGFGLRNRLQWRRRGYVEPVEDRAGLFDGESKALQARETELLARYSGLAGFCGTRQRYRETLTYLDQVDRLLEEVPRLEGDPVAWLDVGAKNWSYVEALHHWLIANTQRFELVGIEYDAYRVYADLHSRRDYAEAYIHHLPHTRYLAGDVRAHTGRYHVISCFLPFVFPEPHLAWGLPGDAFQPEALLQHLVNLLQPGGWLLIVNQGTVEAQEQERLLAGIGSVEIRRRIDFPPSFYPFQHQRVGWLCMKKG